MTDELAVELGNIQQRLEKLAGDDPQSLLEIMDWCAAQIARVGHIRDQAAELLEDAKEESVLGLETEAKGMSVTAYKAKLRAQTAQEQHLVNRCESLLKALGKKFDAAQSSLAWQRSERERLQKR